MSCRLHVDRANLFCRKNSWMIKAFQFSSRKMQTLERPSDPAAWASGYEWSEEPGGGHQETSWEKSGRVMAVKHKRLCLTLTYLQIIECRSSTVRFRRTGINTERPLAKLCDHAFTTTCRVTPSIQSVAVYYPNLSHAAAAGGHYQKKSPCLWYLILNIQKKCPCREIREF